MHTNLSKKEKRKCAHLCFPVRGCLILQSRTCEVAELPHGWRAEMERLMSHCKCFIVLILTNRYKTFLEKEKVCVSFVLCPQSQ